MTIEHKFVSMTKTSHVLAADAEFRNLEAVFVLGRVIGLTPWGGHMIDHLLI